MLHDAGAIRLYTIITMITTMTSVMTAGNDNYMMCCFMKYTLLCAVMQYGIDMPSYATIYVH